jgi:hypothetical protein
MMITIKGHEYERETSKGRLAGGGRGEGRGTEGD